jgi:hypothetical protein
MQEVRARLRSGGTRNDSASAFTVAEFRQSLLGLILSNAAVAPSATRRVGVGRVPRRFLGSRAHP